MVFCPKGSYFVFFFRYNHCIQIVLNTNFNLFNNYYYCFIVVSSVCSHPSYTHRHTHIAHSMWLFRRSLTERLCKTRLSSTSTQQLDGFDASFMSEIKWANGWQAHYYGRSDAAPLHELLFTGEGERKCVSAGNRTHSACMQTCETTCRIGEITTWHCEHLTIIVWHQNRPSIYGEVQVVSWLLAFLVINSVSPVGANSSHISYISTFQTEKKL